MKYSEFKREVEKLGCEVYDRGCDLYIKRNTYTILTVNKNKAFEFDNEWHRWSGIGEIKNPLFDLAYQLAKTPLAEREEEKKYYLRFTTPTLLKNFIPDGYLNIHRESNELSLSSDRKDTEYFKTIFTESEINHMDITGFEKEEVAP